MTIAIAMPVPITIIAAVRVTVTITITMRMTMTMTILAAVTVTITITGVSYCFPVPRGTLPGFPGSPGVCPQKVQRVILSIQSVLPSAGLLLFVLLFSKAATSANKPMMLTAKRELLPGNHYYLRSLSRTSRTFYFPDSREGPRIWEVEGPGGPR